MKITEVRIGRISVPLRTPFKTALRTVNSVEDVVVEIHTDTGAVGYGEAPPTGVITGDTTGAIIGAIINYLLAMWLGRPIIYAFADSKIGHLCMLSSDKIKKAEDYFNQHGKVSTFVGRLIPGIRQLISIPAGLCKMHFGWFLFYTFLGAGIWNIILALLGYITHGQKDLIDQYSHELSIAIMAIFGVAIILFVVKAIIKRHRKNKQA